MSLDNKRFKINDKAVGAYAFRHKLEDDPGLAFKLLDILRPNASLASIFTQNNKLQSQLKKFP